MSIYYVATTGNDSNPGTFVLPWLTMQHAHVKKVHTGKFLSIKVNWTME
jgi:hypothetical protein